MTLPRLTSPYLVPFILLAVFIEMIGSYLYSPRPLLDLFQGTTMIAGVMGFLAAISMTAFVYPGRSDEYDEKTARMLTWMIGGAAIMGTTIYWGKYFLGGPNNVFSEDEFRAAIVMTTTAIVYTLMGFVTWRLVRNKDAETTISSDAVADRYDA